MPKIFSIVKNVRNIMRQDRGVSGDAQPRSSIRSRSASTSPAQIRRCFFARHF